MDKGFVGNGTVQSGTKQPQKSSTSWIGRMENAAKNVVAAGLRTGDIWSEGTTRVGTAQMGDAVVKALT